jgi:hypothetical protein
MKKIITRKELSIVSGGGDRLDRIVRQSAKCEQGDLRSCRRVMRMLARML